ncbi:MAG: carboxypeptidase regulatory-like domain-containing protein [Verrucomicrobiales bacterium]|nr:carboxypeptidase regulatory-like domain-containing protein [Verrucomicrobiales bacterium]
MPKFVLLLTACFLVVVPTLAEALRTASTSLAPSANQESAVRAAFTNSARTTGIVEGIIKYQADPRRPWKLSRYYVRNAKEGSLAEAVVALEGSTLAASAWSNAPTNRTMDQANFQFVPETMAVRAGDAVRITNSDEALHNVMTSDGGKPFNVNVIKGKEFTQRFDRAGGLNQPIRLGCVFHGGMRAWIYVFDHPWFKVTEPDGRFRFENVPAGEYTLGAVHPAGRLRWNQRIEVKPNGGTSVEISLSPDYLIGSKENDR